MQATALMLLEADDTSRCLHLFDTFEACCRPLRRTATGQLVRAAELLAANERTSGVWATAT